MFRLYLNSFSSLRKSDDSIDKTVLVKEHTCASITYWRIFEINIALNCKNKIKIGKFQIYIDHILMITSYVFSWKK